MRILIAEDDPISRRLLEATLVKWEYEVVVTKDGNEAWNIMESEDAPPLLILDWMMPGIDGIELCRRARVHPRLRSPYILILTAKGSREDVIKGLEAGADDYVVKPFDRTELRARVQVGVRIIQLQHDLANRVRELENALDQVRTLRGLLPICSYCKRIRNDQNYWQQVEQYVAEHTEVQFSHSICPDCYEQHVRPELEKLQQQKAAQNEGGIS